MFLTFASVGKQALAAPSDGVASHGDPGLGEADPGSLTDARDHTGANTQLRRAGAQIERAQQAGELAGGHGGAADRSAGRANGQLERRPALSLRWHVDLDEHGVPEAVEEVRAGDLEEAAVGGVEAQLDPPGRVQGDLELVEAVPGLLEQLPGRAGAEAEADPGPRGQAEGGAGHGVGGSVEEEALVVGHGGRRRGRGLRALTEDCWQEDEENAYGHRKRGRDVLTFRCWKESEKWTFQGFDIFLKKLFEARLDMNNGFLIDLMVVE